MWRPSRVGVERTNGTSCPRRPRSPILPGLKPREEGFEAAFRPLLPFSCKPAVYEVVCFPKLQLSFHTVSGLTKLMSLSTSG